MTAGARELEPEEQIRALITRYFMALDRRDFDSIERCFASDATAWYDREYGPGRDAIVAYLRTAMSRWKATTHLGSNLEIVIDDAVARGQVDAVAYLVSVQPGSENARIRVRGLRYADTFALADGRWVFTRRDRLATWSCDIDGRDLTGIDSAVTSPPPPT
jgi:hypothetical protein